MSCTSTPKLLSGVYRIISQASQSTIRVHQYGRPMQLSYGFELMGIFEQFELEEAEKDQFMIRNMGFSRGQVGLGEGAMVINAGNPIPFIVEPVVDGLYAVKALNHEVDGTYWTISQSPTRQNPEINVGLSEPLSAGDFSDTQLWRFERLDGEDGL